MPVVGLEEKRQITAVVASTLNGELLPLQLIFQGQDTKRGSRRPCRRWTLCRTASSRRSAGI